MSHGIRSNHLQALIVGAGILALAVVAGPARLAAQAEIAQLTFPGPGSGEYFGRDFAGAGDVNGDGHDDFVAGTVTGGAAGYGIVQLFSGADFSVLRDWTGDSTQQDFGGAVDSAGDVDGDGLQDVVVGVRGADGAGTDAGLVRVYSSATGALLYDIPGLAAGDRFGVRVAGVGDLDGDGHGDFAGSAPSADGAGGLDMGYVRIFSGADGHEFVSIQGQTSIAQLGGRLRPAGDFDADGAPDVLVSSRGLLDVHLQVYSGAWIVAGTQPALLLDYVGSDFSVYDEDAAGDLNHDGWDDVVVGTSTGYPPLSGWRAISGKDHSLLFDYVGPFPGFYVDGVTGGCDLDLDGYPDVLINEGFASASRTEVFSGRDGSLLYTCLAPAGVSWWRTIAIVGDVNTDGYVDWGVGNSTNGITLFTGAGLWSDLGHGLAGSAGVPTLSGTGPLLGGDPIGVALAGALPNQPFVLVIGLEAVNLPFHGGVFVPDAGHLLFDVTDGNGARQWSGRLPQFASAMSFYFQAWMEDPQAVEGWAASNGLRAQSP